MLNNEFNRGQAMGSFAKRIIQRCKGSSTRTFILYPILVVAWELLLNRGRLRLEPMFMPIIAWGYLQYRLCGQYRIKRGGGGPGMDTPPDRLVTTGIFAYTRNPMYMGHIIFLIGMALSLHSLLAALLAISTVVFFQPRVLRDERRLIERFGEPYVAYMKKVKRWVPGLF
ncbi:MAG: isoprenylcysteine carboxyl methyltransferase [Herminiimonas sp.]|nr:isoprenylcysteine carboxyl methyltransferase [Herminiimonas sp.]